MTATVLSTWRQLEWDTDFFGIGVGEVTAGRLDEEALRKTLAECAAAGIDLLYYLASLTDDDSIRLAELSGFRLADVRVTYGWRVDGSGRRRGAADRVIRPHRAADLPALLDIAATSFQQTRFYREPRIPLELCDLLYRTWITNACRSEHVLVAEQDRLVRGFLTCQVGTDGVGRIGLVGIAGDARGQGIGRALVDGGQQWFRELGVTDVTVVTQGRNLGAQRLYQRSGFTISDTELRYHLWLGESA